MPRLFGKDYKWGMVGGRLILEKPDAWDFAPAESAEEGKPFSYGDFIGFLERVEREPFTFNVGVSEDMGRELQRYASGEGEGRISMGADGDGVSDQEAGEAAGRSDRGVEEQRNGEVACEEGVAEKRVRGVCTSCWFDSHVGCTGQTTCGCWKCYEEEE